MQKVYKGITGWKEADDKHEATHILIDIEEYIVTLANTREETRKQVKKECQAIIDAAEKNFEKSVELKYNEIAEEYEQDKAELFEDYERERIRLYERLSAERKNIEAQQIDLDSKQEETRKINKDLLRLMKERANAKRGIKPKKQHNGYIILRSAQATYRWELPFEDWQKETGSGDKKRYAREKNRYADVWTTTIQSPWDAGMKVEHAAKMIFYDVTDIASDVLDMIGGFNDTAKGIYPGDSRNYIFDWKLEANFTTGFWHITIWHSLPIKVPESLRKPESYA